MDDEHFKCPMCEMEVLVSETTKELPTGERDETYRYSCGHTSFCVTLAAVVIRNIPLPPSAIMKSVEKINDQPKYEIREIGRIDDIDDPNRSVITMYYKNRGCEPHSFFQIVLYGLDEIKHVHCKTCNSQYNYHSTQKLEDLFFIDLGLQPKIECLRCHAKFEQ
jgi:hypothetical protein